MGRRKTYYDYLADEFKAAREAPIDLQPHETEAFLVEQIASITATLCGPLSDGLRIGLAADRKLLHRKLQARKEQVPA